MLLKPCGSRSDTMQRRRDPGAITCTPRVITHVIHATSARAPRVDNSCSRYALRLLPGVVVPRTFVYTCAARVMVRARGVYRARLLRIPGARRASVPARVQP